MKMVTTVKTLLHTLLEDLTFSLRITFELNISTKSSLVLFILDYRAFVPEHAGTWVRDTLVYL